MEVKEYEIGSLLDIVSLDEDQIDRLCAELPVVIKQVKAFKMLIQSAVGIDSADNEALKILNPLTWVDDGKNEITITAHCSDGESVVAKVIQEPKLSDLEIVQKALDKTGFDMLCTGGSFVVADHCWEEIGVDGHHFNDMNELLAWAKQTIGME